MQKSQWVALIFLLLLTAATVTPARAQSGYETENVIIVIIDGLRNEEAFEATPPSTYIPNIWNDLRPKGTIYTEFYHDYCTTYTTPAHATIITGQWHFQPNLVSDTQTSVYYDLRPEAPTIFDYYRDQTSQSNPHDCSIIVGKMNCIQLDWSLTPRYGPDTKVDIYWQAPPQPHDPTDDLVFNMLDTRLRLPNPPKLVLVNLQDVDEAGHQALDNLDIYYDAIINADRLVGRIWNDLIQDIENYRDKTTLIVTTDHGRNAFWEQYVGLHHGGLSHQNRHLFFLAIGPDIAEGRVCTDRRYQIDIVPTVGELLGLETPYACGEVMTGMFKNGLTPSSRIHTHANHPRIAARDGHVGLVWSQNDTGPGWNGTGNARIYFTYEDQNGAFTPSQVISPVAQHPIGPRWALSPDLAVNNDGFHVVWLDGRPPDGTADTWSIYYRRSSDFGLTWEPEELITSSTFESTRPNQLKIVSAPEIIANLTGELIITVRFGLADNNQMTSFCSMPLGTGWNEKVIQQPYLYFPRQFHSLAHSNNPFCSVLAWMSPDKQLSNPLCSWEIFISGTTDAGTNWTPQNRRSIDDEHNFTPRFAANSQQLLLVFAQRDKDGIDQWMLNSQLSTDLGKTWSSQTIPNAEGWQPDVVWNFTDLEYFLCYSSHEVSTLPDLLFITSSDGVNWTSPAPLLANTALRCNPQVAWDSVKNEYVLAWEEYDPSTGKWTIETLRK